MPTCVGVPTPNTKIAIGLETTWGSAPAAMYNLPVLSFSGKDVRDVIRDQTYRGIAAKDFLAQTGVENGDMQLETNFYPEEVAYLCKLIMGAVTTTGAGPYTHAFTLDACPESLRVEEQGVGGATDRRFTGSRVASLGFKFNGAQGYVGVTAGLTGNSYTEVAATATANTPSTAIAGWQGTFNVNSVGAGTGISAQILEGEVNFAREVEVRHGIRASQAPSGIYVGQLEVTWRFTVDVLAADAVTWRNLAKNFTKAPLDFDFVNGSAAELKIHMNSAVFSEPVEIDRGSMANLKYVFSGHAEYNSTDAGPAKITVKNSQASFAT